MNYLSETYRGILKTFFIFFFSLSDTLPYCNVFRGDSFKQIDDSQIQESFLGKC